VRRSATDDEPQESGKFGAFWRILGRSTQLHGSAFVCLS